MVFLYTIITVLIVSLLSLVGLFTLAVDRTKLYKTLIYFVSLAAGTLMGDAFFHLIPEAFSDVSNRTLASVSVLLGIFMFFILEKGIHWRHCHKEPSHEHPHPFSYLILIGDTVHNFIDGMIIAASFLVSIPLGIATAIAVVFHEIPHEIGDFASLIYGGFAIKKAIVYNFLSAMAAVVGALAVLAIDTADLTGLLIPFAAGGFIYIAGTDLIPELHKHNEIKKGMLQTITFIFGIGLMAGLLLME